MTKEYYILQYKYRNESKYLVTYSNDRDGVVTAENKILSFSSITEIKEYENNNSINITSDELQKINLDITLNWVNRKTPVLDLELALSAWNLLSDISSSIHIPFKGDCKSSLTNKIYNKLFWGNNLPAMTPPDCEYTPIWKRHEIKKLTEIFLNGFEIINKNICYHHNLLI